MAPSFVSTVVDRVLECLGTPIRPSHKFWPSMPTREIDAYINRDGQASGSSLVFQAADLLRDGHFAQLLDDEGQVRTRRSDRNWVQRHRGVECAAPLRNAITSVSNLPEELLSLIFEDHCAELLGYSSLVWSTWNHSGEMMGYSHARLRAPFILSAVCTQWRQVALRTPYIWTYIAVLHLEFRNLPPGVSKYGAVPTRRAQSAVDRLCDRWLDMISLQLARSGDCSLLDIRISPNEVANWQFSGDMLSRAVKLLVLHSHRWRSLFIRYRTKVHVFWSLVGDSLPALEELVAQIPDYNYWLLPTHDEAGSRVHLPELRRVCVGGEHLAFTRVLHGPRLPRSWPNTITTLILADNHYPQQNLWSVLSTCNETLQRLAINLTADETFEEPADRTPLHFPSLRYFHISIQAVPAVLTIIPTYIDAPLLEEFHGTIISPGDLDSWRFFMEAMPVHPCVTTVHLKRYLFDAECARIVLEKFPNTKELVVRGGEVKMEFLRELHGGSGSTNVLETVIISQSTPQRWTRSQWLKRTFAMNKSEEARFHFHPYVDEAITIRF